VHLRIYAPTKASGLNRTGPCVSPCPPPAAAPHPGPYSYFIFHNPPAAFLMPVRCFLAMPQALSARKKPAFLGLELSREGEGPDKSREFQQRGRPKTTNTNNQQSKPKPQNPKKGETPGAGLKELLRAARRPVRGLVLWCLVACECGCGMVVCS
jgi:hypothetical protein